MVIQPQYQPVKLAASAFGVLSLTTLLAASIFTNVSTYADDESSTTTNTAEDIVTVTIQSACTLASTGNQHTGSITPGKFSDNIGTTTLTITCNNPNGFAVYAVGYGNNTWNNNKLTGDNDTIATADKATSADNSTPSHWYMKIFDASSGITIHNGFNTEKAIPGSDDATSTDGFKKVASYASTTANPSTTSFKTTYGIYASVDQVAGDYTGKVKYTLVDPHKSDDSNKPKSKDPTYYMQDIANWKDEKLVNIGDTLTAVDKRDDTEYIVGKLADGKIWMLDNLALDLTNSETLNKLSSENTHIDPNNETNILTSLKSGNRTAGNQYATSGVAVESTSTYSDPRIATSGTCLYTSACVNKPSSGQWTKDAVATHTGEGSGKIGIYYNYCAASAGSYCYGSGDDYGSPSGNASSDICPKGWGMPTGNPGGEYATLYSKYTSVADFKKALSTPLSGNLTSGVARNQGSYGSFWSSTNAGVVSMYNLNVNASGVNPSDLGNLGTGYSVRCVFGE